MLRPAWRHALPGDRRQAQVGKRRPTTSGQKYQGQSEGGPPHRSLRRRLAPALVGAAPGTSPTPRDWTGAGPRDQVTAKEIHPVPHDDALNVEGAGYCPGCRAFTALASRPSRSPRRDRPQPLRLRSLLLGRGAAGFGALDALLFGGATAPDVRLHRRYNPVGPQHLQCWRPEDQLAARLRSKFSRSPIRLAVDKMGWPHE